MNRKFLKRLLKKITNLFKWALLLSPFGMFAIVCIDTYVVVESQNKTFSSAEEIPHNKVGLLLGTGKYTQGGRLNLYYAYRLQAAIDLYTAGKIDFILVSGDNGKVGYDEPTDFKNDLVAHGIPENKIILDFAGFSTLDSVIRAQKIFGANRFTVISQEFHNQRAILLAHCKNMEAIGFNAKEVTGKFALRTDFREYLARTKACLDILFNSQPKYLGEKIAIQ